MRPQPSVPDVRARVMVKVMVPVYVELDDRYNYFLPISLRTDYNAFTAMEMWDGKDENIDPASAYGGNLKQAAEKFLMGKYKAKAKA